MTKILSFEFLSYSFFQHVQIVSARINLKPEVKICADW